MQSVFGATRNPEFAKPAYRPVKKFVDPWLPVCGRCPLDDCVRTEGALSESCLREVRKNAKRGCPVSVARLRKWTPETALKNWRVLDLLEYEPETSP